jgi:hypothetical protein
MIAELYEPPNDLALSRTALIDRVGFYLILFAETRDP